VEELIGKQLPKIKLMKHEGGHQPEVKSQLVIRRGSQKRLHDENSGIDDQEKFDRGRNAARTE
jgi:hypothetical protein